MCSNIHSGIPTKSMGEVAVSTNGTQSLRVTSICCGSSHTLALLNNGIVLSWGRGEDGQLGHGDAEERARPQAIYHLRSSECSSVYSGAEYSVALSTAKNEVYSWGWGDFGRLGHGDCNDIFIPQSISALSGRNIVKIACGDTHTLAVTDTGSLFAFGRNQNGQLGIGSTNDALLPHPVEALKGIEVRAVACGGEHSLAATEAGELYTWGWGRYGNLGLGRAEDRLIPVKGVKVVSMSCGAEHSVGLSDTGVVYAWGWGSYGNLGDGERVDRWAPVKVLGMEDVKVVSVACGWRHSIAADSTGTVYTFGWSKYGQLGHGDTSDQLSPKAVEALKDRRVVAIAGGWRHTAAADDAGKLYTWGWNKFGQLGSGSTSDSHKPVQVRGLGDVPVRLLSCGWRHTVAVNEASEVYSWGRGVNGQLGHSVLKDTPVPKRLDDLSTGTINADELGLNALPAGSYVPPADRYAIVPDNPSPAGAGNQRFSTVPEMPAAKKPRA